MLDISGHWSSEAGNRISTCLPRNMFDRYRLLYQLSYLRRTTFLRSHYYFDDSPTLILKKLLVVAVIKHFTIYRNAFNGHNTMSYLYLRMDKIHSYLVHRFKSDMAKYKYFRDTQTLQKVGGLFARSFTSNRKRHYFHIASLLCSISIF